LNALCLTDFEPTDVEPISAFGLKVVPDKFKIVSYKNLRQGSRDEGDDIYMYMDMYLKSSPYIAAAKIHLVNSIYVCTYIRTCTYIYMYVYVCNKYIYLNSIAFIFNVMRRL
jgi:hypothetical protein